MPPTQTGTRTASGTDTLAGPTAPTQTGTRTRTDTAAAGARPKARTHRGGSEHESAPGHTLVADLLALGLGNPGQEFDGSRHNYGAVAVRLVASRHQARLRPERGTSSETASVRLDGKLLVLATPKTYMNDSGLAAQSLTRRYLGEDKATFADRLVVVHDELDLPPGIVRIKQGGGTAGHNGLRSIQSHLHTQSFLRVRIGIGKPPGRSHGADHVLKRPSKKDRELIEVAVEVAADAVEAIAAEGVAAAMNRFNSKP